MLNVLSEINCLELLESKGIYPDSFYTDFELFKKKSTSFKDADVVIFKLGTCSFSGGQIIEFVNLLRKRVQNEKDKGIKSVTLVSDIEMPVVGEYYRCDEHFTEFEKYNGKKLDKKGIDFITMLDDMQDKEDNVIQTFYSDFDKGNSEPIRESILNKEPSSEDELIRLIKRVNVLDNIKLTEQQNFSN